MNTALVIVHCPKYFWCTLLLGSCLCSQFRWSAVHSYLAVADFLCFGTLQKCATGTYDESVQLKPLPSLHLRDWRWRQYVPLKPRYTRRQSPEDTDIFTAVRTSDLTQHKFCCNRIFTSSERHVKACGLLVASRRGFYPISGRGLPQGKAEEFHRIFVQVKELIKRWESGLQEKRSWPFPED
jgi:hypothetical protein